MADRTAREFFNSYEAATRSGDAKGLALHYAEPYTSFTLGHVGVFATRSDAIAALAPYLKRLHDFGIDDVRLIDLSVTPVSETFCLCYPTWEIRPRDGTPAWSFLNAYGLRQDGQGPRFEFGVVDNEATALMKRYPAVMQLG